MFILYINITRPQSCFDYTNFRASLVVKIINFSEINFFSDLAMLVIFYVDVTICQNFNLPHVDCIFAEKIHFLR